MNILNQPPQDPITPAKRIAAKMKRDAYNQFHKLVAAYEIGLYQFWRSPDATPQEIAAELGTDALAVFQLHGITKQIILDAKPDQVLSSVSDFGTFQANPDGTLTILSVVAPEQQLPLP